MASIPACAVCVPCGEDVGGAPEELVEGERVGGEPQQEQSAVHGNKKNSSHIIMIVTTILLMTKYEEYDDVDDLNL